MNFQVQPKPVRVIEQTAVDFVGIVKRRRPALEKCRPLIVITGSKHCSLPHHWPFRKGPALIGVTALEAAPRLAASTLDFYLH